MFFKKKSVKLFIALVVALLVLVLVYRWVRKGRKEGFENAVTVTYFYLPECPYCKDFETEWAKFEQAAKADGITTVKVDGTDASKKDLVAKHKVTHYPTVIVTKDGKNTPYEGARTATDLHAFVKGGPAA